MIAQAVFWSSIAFILYAYFGYPLLLLALSLFRSHPVKKGNITPRVSFIITAYNEEDRIAEKIENTLEQDYHQDKLEIIVASDCSTDGTDTIVKSYRCRGVNLVRAAERKGKENAQKNAVDTAAGEILVFSDVATILKPDGVSNIVRNFQDPTVGCVSSVDKFIAADGSLSGEGIYIRYEMFLRSLESRVNTLIGLSGSFFAARREVCRNWAPDLQSDFNTLLNSARLGLRGIADAGSIGFYKNILHERKEFERKVRTVIRGISVLMRNLPLLNVFRYGLFSWQLFSHKLCRWLVPFAMILAVCSNVILLPQGTFYLYAFILQAGFYGIGLSGICAGRLPDKRIFKIPSFFVLANLSILHAWYRYARGERMASWNPSKR